MYFRDSSELERVRLFLATLRGKQSGLSDEQVRQAVECALGMEVVETEQPALPSNADREIPHTLQRFIDEGWDLDTAFRVYDEWKSEINNVGGDVYVKSLNQRFMEERMKRDADESAE